jgi:hypothetical protein
MKRIFILIILLISVWTIVYSADNTDKSPTLSEKTNYDLYEERVTNFCSEYKKTDETSESIYNNNNNDENYKNLSGTTVQSWSDLKEAREKYRKDMDWIYDCGVALTELRTLQAIKDLSQKNEKIGSQINGKITQRIDEINENNKKCKVNWKKDILIKKSVLKQATYEHCRYIFYLEYLKEANEEIKNLWPFDSESDNIPISEIFTKRTQKQNQIAEEINDVIKAFPIVFKAYANYENNTVVHILLQLLREDYLVFREELHKNLNPINQVVYKVANAMRK